MLAKSNWFRKEQDDENIDIYREYREGKTPTHSTGGRGKNTTTGKQAGAKLRTSTVMFVEFSRGGRDVLDRIAPMLGFKVRVT